MHTLNLADAELRTFVAEQNTADYAKHPVRTLAKLFCVDVVETPAGYILPDYGSVVVSSQIGQTLAFIRSKNQLCISTTAATAATVVLSRLHSQHKLDAAFSGGKSFDRLVDFAQYVTKTDRYGYLFKYAAQVLIFYKLSAMGH